MLLNKLRAWMKWVGNPGLNIRGGSISTLVCFGLIAVMDLIIIKFALPRSLSYIRAFLKPVVSAAIMGLATWAVYGLVSRLFTSEAGELSGTGNALATLVAIGVGVIIYFVLILVTHAISREDLTLMPKGDKIAKLLRIR